jgi:hypothetical protein
MRQTQGPRRGHVILVATPHEGTQPTYRAYIVADDDPVKARALVARGLRPDEIVYTLAAFPDVMGQIPGLEAGRLMRL